MVGAAGAIKESTAWVGKKEAIKDLKTLGARIKFRTKLEKLQQMVMSCYLITNDDINNYMQKTNRLLYNKMSVMLS